MVILQFKMAADIVKSEEKESKVPFIKNGPRVQIVPGMIDSVKFTILTNSSKQFIY